jgi:ribosomal protein S18 acetylase RimI-like enzyme
MITTRISSPSDSEFVLSMLIEAAYPPHARPSTAEAEEDGRLRQWLTRFGDQKGDHCRIAFSDEVACGMALCRVFDDLPVQGVVGIMDQRIPSLAIAVKEGFRQRGIGKLLLQALYDDAVLGGYSAISLCVSQRNDPAIKLYESTGFRVVASDNARMIMVKERSPFQAK